MTQGLEMHTGSAHVPIADDAKKAYNWNTLSRQVMELDVSNYAQQSSRIVIELQSLLVADADSTRNISLNVMYIIYERALRELVTSSFPISANIVESLGSTPEILHTFQTLTRNHIEGLLKKLEKSSPLFATNVGVMFSLLSLHRLDQQIGKKSALPRIFDRVVNVALQYIESFSDFKNADLLLMLLYALIMYSLNNSCVDDKTLSLLNFMRRTLTKHGDHISNFTKVLVLDIMERSQNNKPTQLYERIYQKIFQADHFIIPGLNKFVSSVKYPGGGVNGVCETKTLLAAVSLDERSGTPPGKSNDVEMTDEKSLQALDVAGNKAVTEVLPVADKDERILDNTTSNNDIDISKETVKEAVAKAKETVSKVSTAETTIPSDNVKPQLKWSISQMQEPIAQEEKVTEIIEVPENCIGRVVGFQGAIARKLELESNATIEVCQPAEPPRPDTSCLTAHKLVTGSLGIPVQMAPEQIEEEKQKLSNAKVRRLTEERGEKMRVIKITGSEEEINNAVALIKDIITCGVTIHVFLDFTVDEILERYSGKLKTIEFLLNIHLEVEELENQNVVLNISGDQQSCQDAKKLIFDEIGSFRSQHGSLFFVPNEMMAILKDKQGVKKLSKTVQTMTNARILPLQSEEANVIFVSGYQHQINRSLQIFQKVNADVMCAAIEPAGDGELTTEDICQFLKNTYKRGSRGENKCRPAFFKKQDSREAEDTPARLCYTKEQLIELSKSKISRTFPEKLVLLEDPEVKSIILYECGRVCCDTTDGNPKLHA